MKEKVQIAGFIGFGLIGGSIAKAMKVSNPDCTLIAFNYHKNANPSLELALTEGNLDYVETDLHTRFQTCDIIFLCAPVLRNIAYLKELKDIMKPTCILTDVGSVKENIYQAAVQLGLEENFIGGHPMAGSEKTGYESSHSSLLENAYYVLAPTDKTPDNLINTMVSLVNDIKALPVILNCKEHDDIVAAISHVPHIMAAVLVNMIRESDSSDGKMFSLAAGGFKDITRIASSSPVMWQNICLTNADSILKFIKVYQNAMEQVAKSIETQDESALLDYFDTAKNYRDSIPNHRIGMLNKVYELYVDVMDETGIIATLATLLASNGISIKNIGIIHNREFQEGALRIELYDQDSCDNAAAIFKRHHYTIFER